MRRERTGARPRRKRSYRPAVLAVEAGHRLKHADRLVRALALDDPGDRELQPALDLLDVEEGGGQPDLGSHRHRRGETDLGETVVHTHLSLGDPEELRPQ